MKLLHLCLSSRANQLLRWQQAFPHGRILCDSDQLTAYLVAPALVWIHSDGLTGIPLTEAVARLARNENCRHIVAISCVPSRQESLAALSAGASGYCHAFSTPELLRRVATVVSHGGLWVGRDLIDQLASRIAPRLDESEAASEPEVLQKLSSREREVARQIQQGAANKEIASALGITERTVKAHLGSIFQKLEIRDRLQLILLLAQKNA